LWVYELLLRRVLVFSGIPVRELAVTKTGPIVPSVSGRTTLGGPVAILATIGLCLALHTLYIHHVNPAEVAFSVCQEELRVKRSVRVLERVNVVYGIRVFDTKTKRTRLGGILKLDEQDCIHLSYSPFCLA